MLFTQKVSRFYCALFKCGNMSSANSSSLKLQGVLYAVHLLTILTNHKETDKRHSKTLSLTSLDSQNFHLSYNVFRHKLQKYET